MTSDQMRLGRKKAGLTQVQAAAHLGLSQPYLSLLERGRRPVTAAVARAATSRYRLPPTALPLPPEPAKGRPDRDDLARELAALGYPGYSHLRPGPRKNPALVVLKALSTENLDARVSRAMPWLLVRYPDLEWDWLVSRAKLRDLQNRLGFLVQVAREFAEKRPELSNAATRLTQVEQKLEGARLAAETTLGREAMPAAERDWLRAHRSPQARRWNVLTSLTPDQLPYGS